ncbi:dihydropyrimidinase [Halarchaeum solikamskense]|uniref:dihydroorotase n=1 Tax=Halarchaeum nitratireducens TaxID=489913 RepID=UPI001B3AD649|nr:amidohydrolase family protein [Halarchaeum solikamskense]MBP2252466.1 dihydropyrimidinase [Halarchaeum solikamskense]
MSVDTVIAGGTLVTASGTREGALAIDGGEIVGVGDEAALPDADERVDATDRLVMPGVVDPHVHIGDHVSIDSYETATRAAALGGVTTVVDFAWQAYTGAESPWDEPAPLLDGVEEKRANAAEALVDFGLHGGILREDDDLFAELEDVVEAGVTSFKMYTAYDYGLSNGFMEHVFERLAEHGAVGLVHSEDDSVCEARTERLRAAGRDEPEAYPESRPDYAEAMAAEDAVRLAREAGAKYYGIHTTARASAEVMERFREDGSRVRAETCVHYATLDDSVYAELGNLPKIAPPIRAPDDVEAMFEYLRQGVLSVVSTDHVAAARADKEDRPWWEGPFGANGVQRSLPVFHDEAVNERSFSYPFLVRVMCANPAETFGMPEKGTLDPGTDADVVVFDPDATHTVTAEENASKADYSIYEGREVTGRVRKTFVRGELVADDGNIVAEPGHGEFLEREIPEWGT